jgi:hypothetical protein
MAVPFILPFLPSSSRKHPEPGLSRDFIAGTFYRRGFLSIFYSNADAV